ncbi:iron-containing alcohol dehydrogenase [Catenisphaera adipataccumulans]|uniref:Alcohol dehydrogenase YqhD (Iron-dependent ADH family) n=1 Tax=Catenisphaera adipataccumulans TaxID=700500 RepID=A0A7W8FWU4_9FIRM|nr:iron-containing alcohol dehydrogenase [Catenisphaera adipataccumulans]MBB5182965.1 alcohol dehydrogenase YqhD (iron-dependent ADH family) [Catenisphaera adipataccumulans]
METFQYMGMPKVYFGQGILKTALDAEIPETVHTVMIAYGGGSIKRTGIFDSIVDYLSSRNMKYVEFSGIMPNPTYAKVQEGAKLAVDAQVDLILAVGGGSVIDCCKVIAVQAKTDKDLWQSEFVDHIYPTDHIPLAAVTTVSGTGSEMNNGAVITNESTLQKNGMLGAMADFVVLDPSYTLTVPMMQAVSGAFDTLSHCMETYFGKPAEINVSDEMNESVMRNVIRNIRAMIKDPKDVKVRSELMWDASMAENGILKIGKITDFQNHMLEHQLGAYTDCNHGQGLAVIHPTVYRHLLKDNTARFARFAKEVFGVDTEGKSEEQAASEGIDALQAFIREIGLPCTLTELKNNMRHGTGDPTDPELLRKIADSTIITKGCARQMDADEIYTILTECIA